MLALESENGEIQYCAHAPFLSLRDILPPAGAGKPRRLHLSLPPLGERCRAHARRKGGFHRYPGASTMYDDLFRYRHSIGHDHPRPDRIGHMKNVRPVAATCHEIETVGRTPLNEGMGRIDPEPGKLDENYPE